MKNTPNSLKNIAKLVGYISCCIIFLSLLYVIFFLFVGHELCYKKIDSMEFNTSNDKQRFCYIDDINKKLNNSNISKNKVVYYLGAPNSQKLEHNNNIFYYTYMDNSFISFGNLIVIEFEDDKVKTIKYIEQ